MRTYLVTLLFFASCHLIAQVKRVDLELENQKWEEPSHYYNGITFDFLNIVTGRLGLSYERKVSTKFILNVEANYLLPYYRGYSIYQLFKYPIPSLGNASGFSIRVLPKYLYMSSVVGDAGWVGISYEFAFENFETTSRNRQTLAIHWGAESALFRSERLYFSYSIGAGFTFIEQTDASYIPNYGFVMPVKLGIGYLL